mmetsp:Transcript_18510/g.38785  ORF Transcript_18510/g.38785 Transcript_18510/m.38785 type:complete len:469 (-) Transcript_18510:1230-2636(-)
MGLVDTACVGQIPNGTIQLAALGPVSNIFLFIVQIFSFLGTSATQLTSSTMAGEASEIENRARVTVVLWHGLAIALVLGSGMGWILMRYATPILAAAGVTTNMMRYSRAYMIVRAIGIPGTMLLSVAQGVCVGLQDALSPLIIFVLAGLVNLLGDLILIFRFDMGVTGAALATTVSTYVGAFLFLWLLWIRSRERRKDQLLQLTTPTSIPITNDTKTHGWRSLKPDSSILTKFFVVGNTLLIRSLATMTSYVLMTLAATGLGTVPLATHQIALQLFWFLSFFAEPLSVCGQSFLARLQFQPSRSSAFSLKVMELAAIVGFCAAIAILVCHGPLAFLFSSDPEIVRSMRDLTPWSMVSEVVQAIVCALDGIAIGSGNFDILTLSALTGLAVVGASLALGQAFNLGLALVWVTMFLFFCSRLAVHGMYLLYCRNQKGQWPVFRVSSVKATSTSKNTTMNPSIAARLAKDC